MKPNSHDIWNKKPVTSNKTHDLSTDEIIVPTQKMFPNCQKYTKCCSDSGTEEMLEKFDKLKEEPITVNTSNTNRIKIIKKIKPVKENPFPDGDNW